MNQVNRVVVIAVAVACGAGVAAAPEPQKKAPGGFTSVFNGKDLTGWRGRQPNYNPAEEAKLPPEELAAKQAQWNAARDAHWRVDSARGEIVSDGESPLPLNRKRLRRFRVPR